MGTLLYSTDNNETKEGSGMLESSCMSVIKSDNKL